MLKYSCKIKNFLYDNLVFGLLCYKTTLWGISRGILLTLLIQTKAMSKFFTNLGFGALILCAVAAAPVVFVGKGLGDLLEKMGFDNSPLDRPDGDVSGPFSNSF